MRFLPFLLGLSLVGFAACSSGGNSSEGGEVAPTPTATSQAIELPTPQPFTTTVLAQALPEPVPVPGESLVYEERFSDENVFVGEIWITLSDDFDRRHDLILCAWRETSGWATCSAAGAGGSGTPVALPAGDGPVEIYLLLEPHKPGPWQPLRRLSRIDQDSTASALALRSEYRTVADVLTMQPGPDGNYLEVTS